MRERFYFFFLFYLGCVVLGLIYCGVGYML